MTVRTEAWQPHAGQVTILEALPGENRRFFLSQLLRQAEEQVSARTWLLDCCFEDGGPWAGVENFFSSILEEIRRSEASLLVRHDHELLQVLPELQESFPLRFPTLTDLSVGDEKVRGYPADRVFRSVHGLIDLLTEWKSLTGETPWVIACDRYDAASRIGQRFFRELARRRGLSLNLSLIVAGDPGTGSELHTSFALDNQGPVWSLELPAESQGCGEDELLNSTQIQELDGRIGNDRIQVRKNMARMIRLWERVGNRERLLKWRLLGLEICTDNGLYEDARVYGEKARRLAKELRPEDGALRWMIFFKLFSCHMALRDVSAALQLAEEDGPGKTARPEWRSQLYYLMAMLYARYMSERDFGKAEAYLKMGLDELEAADQPEESRVFGTVFNRNGLAMVRHFQGRYSEALELCQSSFENLNSHLSEEKHKLHRSVLLYNLGQVHSAIGRYSEAVVHYSAAIAMDPNYSEYFNDRGSLLLRMGALGEALADFLRAIELSPPYFEVYTNLGQCYRRMERMDEAVRAYSVALDLEPHQVLAWLGRAQAREALGQATEAISDYSRSLELAPNQWDALANRAALFHEMKRYRESLIDLNRAIQLAPDQSDLYQNRAVVQADLGFLKEAARDLEIYLALQPDAPDRAVVEERLLDLRSLAGALRDERSASREPRRKVDDLIQAG